MGPFSAELRITHPTRPLAFGRQLQDEHGCMRRETVHPDGSLMITITNFETEKTYRLMRGSWTEQSMRLIPGLPRRPRTATVERQLNPIEGFEAYLSVMPMKSPRGDYTQESIVIPALNFFVAHQVSQNGETITAQNIRLGAPDHAEFLPPPGAATGKLPGVGGSIQLSAVVIVVTFAGKPPLELTTTEERPVNVTTPVEDTVQLVTTVVDDAKNLVRVRIMKNAVAKGPGPGNVHGDVLDDVQLTLGGTVQTTKLPENFTVTVTRIRDRWAGR